MDPWQTSVENRLGSLDTRLGSIEKGVATLTERVAHLPSKGFIISVVTGAAALVAGLSLFGDHIRALLH